MNPLLFLAIGFICLFGTMGFGQAKLNPTDVPTDPRSVAMGESFTALPANQAALMYNPAALAGLSGISASYNQRSYDLFGNDDWYYQGVTASVAVPFGVFGAHYNRFSMGTIPVTTVEYPDGTGEQITLYQHDIALGFGMAITEGLSAGLAGKMYDYHTGFSSISTTPAWLFDAGVIYSFKNFHTQALMRDCFTFGLSIQNIGTKFKASYSSNPQGWKYENTVELPQYLRFGFAYTLEFFQSEERVITPVRGVLTGDLCKLLNPERGSGENFWGIGVELSIYDLLSLRGGWVWLPYDGIYGEDESGSPFRYGAGITLPFEQLGVDIPFRCSANYAAIPLRELGLGLGSPQSTHLDSFSFELQYTGGL